MPEPGKTTANSSPPIRPNTSVARSAPLATSQNFRITASPTAWPKVSLISLKRSRSNISTETGDPSRRQRSTTRSARSMKPPRLAMPVSGSVLAAIRLAVSSRSLTKARRKTALPSRNSMLSKWMSPARLSNGGDRVLVDPAAQESVAPDQRNGRVHRSQDDEGPARGEPFGAGAPQGVGGRKQVNRARRENQRVDSAPRRR